MNLINKLLESRLAQVLCSSRLRKARQDISEFLRKASRKGHHASFYFDLEDPYSALMLPVIEELELAFKVSFHIHVVEPRRSEFCPEKDARERYGLSDAGYLAQAWGLDFPGLIPNQKRLKTEALRLLLKKRSTTAEWLQLAKRVSDAYWHGDFSALHKMINEDKAIDAFDVKSLLKENTEAFYKRGFFMGSSIYYRGDWYWGLDRLYLLRQRLSRYLAQEHKTKLYPDWGQVRVPCRPHDDVDMYFSFRSPYSYIAIARLYLNKSSYPPESITLKPVLPMVTRGLPVPKVKKMYILKDAARIAHFEGIAFGRVWDPLGQGVDACIAVFEESPSSIKLDIAYDLMNAIWAEGVDVSSSKFITSICAKHNLSQTAVEASIHSKKHESNVEKNRRELTRLGLWGVPSFRKGKLVAWGQDRMPLIFERAFK